MVNNMLAFYFMFYFIACTFADPAEKLAKYRSEELAKCRFQMLKADLLHEKDSKYYAQDGWNITINSILDDLVTLRTSIINEVTKIAETLLKVSRNMGIIVKEAKTKYMAMSSPFANVLAAKH
ncbi:uncharacterized protein LOC103310246 [Acyrthosiphon pisum]|uniref:Uncharacterized protein n=1 Tax=Acyrthosiphon pisum TaxID=7029 RepID=A0A8R2JN10_ACYPI|nr:uncharacterized protein LOC103310246 [Acyrthosiphon pisum]